MKVFIPAFYDYDDVHRGPVCTSKELAETWLDLTEKAYKVSGRYFNRSYWVIEEEDLVSDSDTFAVSYSFNLSVAFVKVNGKVVWQSMLGDAQTGKVDASSVVSYADVGTGGKSSTEVVHLQTLGSRAHLTLAKTGQGEAEDLQGFLEWAKTKIDAVHGLLNSDRVWEAVEKTGKLPKGTRVKGIVTLLNNRER